MMRSDTLCCVQTWKRGSVLTLSETWLDSSVDDGEVAIEGYTVIRRDRNRHGGGVPVYIPTDMKPTRTQM